MASKRAQNLKNQGDLLNSFDPIFLLGKNPHLYGSTCAHDYNDARLGFSGEVVAVG